MLIWRTIPRPTAIGLLVIVLLPFMTPDARAHRGPWYWSFAKVMARVDGTKVTANVRTFRLDSDLVVCGGEGRGVIRAGRRAWKHFRCLQYVIKLHRDLSVRVHVVGKKRFVTSDAHLLEGY